MRLLFLSPAVPFPSNNGINMRSAAVLKALADLGHDIHLIALGPPEEANNEEAKQVCSSISMVPYVLKNLSASADYAARLRNLASPLPYGVVRYQVPAMRDTISRVLQHGEIDAVVCNGIGVLVNLPETRVPVLLDVADVEHIILKRYLKREHNPAKFVYAWLEYRKLKAWEQGAYKKTNHVVLCSEFDKSVAQQMAPSVPISVVPNVVDTDYYKPVAPVGGTTLLYTGGMDWYPNRDAVEFFAFSILPAIRQRVPEVKFVVAGRNPSPDFVREFDGVPGMEFTGTVPDIRPYIAAATVCVVPLRIGSGTRLKILEAGAMAKSMVSTRLGAEGLDFVDGSEIVLADEPAAFANAVVELLGDPGRRASMGTSARKRVEQGYSYSVLKRSLNKALENIADPVHSFIA
jgi:glycosyltransferase involved in cell wall biosynthesis